MTEITLDHPVEVGGKLVASISIWPEYAEEKRKLLATQRLFFRSFNLWEGRFRKLQSA